MNENDKLIRCPSCARPQTVNIAPGQTVTVDCECGKRLRAVRSGFGGNPVVREQVVIKGA